MITTANFRAYIDLNKLPENAEATKSAERRSLTEGAIGYRKFAVISGEKAMAASRLQDGSHPPFGAEVKNDNQQMLDWLMTGCNKLIWQR